MHVGRIKTIRISGLTKKGNLRQNKGFAFWPERANLLELQISARKIVFYFYNLLIRGLKNCAECHGIANPDLCELALKGHHFPSIGLKARCSGMSSWIALQGHHKFY